MNEFTGPKNLSKPYISVSKTRIQQQSALSISHPPEAEHRVNFLPDADMWYQS